jgi:hypothetical protein
VQSDLNKNSLRKFGASFYFNYRCHSDRSDPPAGGERSGGIPYTFHLRKAKGSLGS